MTQLQQKTLTTTSRPTLSLVTDIYDPDPALLSMARWYFNQALGWAGTSEEAATQVARSFKQVLWLAENPYSPNPHLTYAKTEFLAMKADYEMIYGEGNLPSKIYGWAKNLRLFDPPVVMAKEVDPVAAAAKRAEAERKRKERSEKDKADRAAMKGLAGGGGKKGR